MVNLFTCFHCIDKA